MNLLNSLGPWTILIGGGMFSLYLFVKLVWISVMGFKGGK